MYILTKICH